MYNEAFYRLLQHIGSNGPRSNAEVDRIDRESGSSDAMSVYDRY